MHQTQSNTYLPGTDDPYMTPSQIQYFRNKLFQHKDRLLTKLKHSRKKIQQMRTPEADILDRSNTLLLIEQEIRATERYSRYLNNIEIALSRVENGTFGFCEITGEKIGIKRLEIQPWATLSIEALEELEMFSHNRHSKSFV